MAGTTGAVSGESEAAFMAEHRRSVEAKWAELARQFPPSEQQAVLLTVAEARLVVAARHLERLCRAHAQGLDYIERMLWDQACSLALSPSHTHTHTFHL